MNEPCPFCTLPAGRIVMANDLAAAIRDGFPVSRGHTLIMPRRHVGLFFEITETERSAMMALLDAAKAGLDNKFLPDSYNVGQRRPGRRTDGAAPASHPEIRR